MDASIAPMLKALADRVGGPVLVAGDPGFADEVSCFNTAVVNTPDVVVGAASESDVVEAVRYAQQNGLPVRVQATGHGAHVPVTDGMLVTTRRMDRVAIDPATKTATVGAGTCWRDVVAAAAEHSLAPIPGSSLDVGVVGYLLGGGLGPLVRSHGFSSDYLMGARVVTADGSVLEASADDNVDLLWALRGGKGGLGVVTEARIRLVELASLYAGSLFFEAEHIEDVLRVWVEWTADAPGEVTTSVAIVRFPDFEQVPEPFRGRRLLSLRFAFPGSDDEGARLAAPLRAAAPVYLDMLGTLPVAQLGAIHNDPSEPGPAWGRGMLLNRIDQDFVSALMAELGPDADVPFIAAEVRHLGSAAGTDVPEGSAVGGRIGEFTMMLVGVPDPTLFETVLPAAADHVTAAIEHWLCPETNVNFAGHFSSLEQFRSAWPAQAFDRLAELRHRYDPARVFAYAPE